MPQSLSAVYIHLVFSTKERFPLLSDAETWRAAFACLSGTSKNLDCPTIAVGGQADHVHLLARLGRTISQADWVKELKRVSSEWLKEQGPQDSKFQWRAGYADFSGFQDELRTLLRKYQIDFDERPVWH